VSHEHSEIAGRVDCGPEGCELDWLTSTRLQVDEDPVAFQKLATDAGWGDGLPLVPPTEERVRGHLVASGRFPDECVAELPPRNGRCTVEKVAVNAVMAGAPAESVPLLCAAIDAIADPVFNLFGLNTTTSCVVPGVFVNGPARHELSIPFDAGCFGGVAGPAPAVGRALRLVMRNVGGQVVGVTSKTVFGQPGRVAGIVVGEGRSAPRGRRWPSGGTSPGTPSPFTAAPGRSTSPTSSPTTAGTRSRSSARRWRSPARTRSSARTTAPRSSSASRRRGPTSSPRRTRTSRTSRSGCGRTPRCPSSGGPSASGRRRPRTDASATTG
jgi:hypothetical protein